MKSFAVFSAVVFCLAGCHKEYPLKVKENFMGTCEPRHGEEFCKCLLYKIEEEYPVEEFLEMEEEMLRKRDLTPPKKMRKMAKVCLVAKLEKDE